jgi:PadR family transcriptional regulator
MHGSEARGFLHPFLLLLICEQPGHGYDLINRLACLGVPDVEPGHVYKVLRSLERDNLVVSAWLTSEPGPARRQYQLTAGGHADLAAWMARLAELDHMLDACLARWAKVSACPGAHASQPVTGSAVQRPGAPLNCRPLTGGRPLNH